MIDSLSAIYIISIYQTPAEWSHSLAGSVFGVELIAFSNFSMIFGVRARDTVMKQATHLCAKIL